MTSSPPLLSAGADFGYGDVVRLRHRRTRSGVAEVVFAYQSPATAYSTRIRVSPAWRKMSWTVPRTHAFCAAPVLRTSTESPMRRSKIIRCCSCCCCPPVCITQIWLG